MIDADTHVAPASIDDLLPYLSEHWRETIARTAFAGPPESVYPPAAPPAGGGGAVAETSLDAYAAPGFRDGDLDAVVLTCAYAIDTIKNPYAAAAIARAVNDWLAERWLERDARMRASLVVPSQQPGLAVEEIARAGGDPGFVQVLLPLRSAIPYGNLLYHPLHAAAAERGLAVCLHYGGSPGTPPTASGWPSFHAEHYAAAATLAQAQLTSLIAEGVFRQVPALRVTVAEAGFAWLPAWLWRFDKDWRMLRREIPWAKDPPSREVAEHVRLTLRPLDGPDAPAELAALVAEPEPVRLADLLLYASDHPHAHGDAAALRFLDLLPPEDRERICGASARAWLLDER